MNAYEMMQAIAKTLKDGETIQIHVSHARGYTYVETYEVSRCAIQCIGHSWGGQGTVRREYAKRVLGRKEGTMQVITNNKQQTTD